MNADLIFAISTPLGASLAALRLLQRGSERALVLPTPMMMWLLFWSQRATTAPWCAVLIGHSASLVVLAGCWSGKRKLAQLGAICCGAAALWLQLSGGFNQG